MHILNYKNKVIFNPDMYIILNYSGNNHYDLITYDKNYFISSFKFKELPYIVKKTIVETCYEEFSGKGAFSIIEDVREFAKNNGLQTQKKIDALQELKNYKYEEKQEKHSLNEKLPSSDIENNVVLIIGKNLDKNKQYHVGKKDNNLHGETIDSDVIKYYKTNKISLEKYMNMCYFLDKEKQWRVKLDDSYEIPNGIIIDGKKYKSVE